MWDCFYCPQYGYWARGVGLYLKPYTLKLSPTSLVDLYFTPLKRLTPSSGFLRREVPSVAKCHFKSIHPEANSHDAQTFIVFLSFPPTQLDQDPLTSVNGLSYISVHLDSELLHFKMCLVSQRRLKVQYIPTDTNISIRLLNYKVMGFLRQCQNQILSFVEEFFINMNSFV